MSAKILVFPTKHLWVFVLRAPTIEYGNAFIVPFTVVTAPLSKADDHVCLAPFIAGGWEPLFRSTDGCNTPIASEWQPGDPVNSFNHAVNSFLSQEDRIELRAENVRLMYVAPHLELRRSS
ncbi:hypothetical protein KBC59_01345 [Patescibacteria group bacterium]|jgi:hypothetical protein|nr:hypothetical protein [Patescibacteria group bacterium]